MGLNRCFDNLSVLRLAGMGLNRCFEFQHSYYINDKQSANPSVM